MPTIAEALAEGERALLVGRAAELSLFERWLDHDPRPPEVLEISGPGGIGKTSLLGAFGRIAQARGREIVQVDVRSAAGSPAGLLEALGGADADSAAQHLNRIEPVVLLDTFEDAGDLQQVLADQLLPRLETTVRVVIAGRGRVYHRWRARRPGSVSIRSVALGGLTPHASRTYLRRRGLTDDRLIAQILQLVGGHPLALTLAADLVLHTGLRDFGASPERHLLIRSLAEDLLGNLSNPHLRELIEASAVVEQFDQSTLEAIVQRSGGEAEFEQLCSLSVVRPAPHGLALHDEVRRILADDLRWRHNARYTEWRRRAMEHYRERMHLASTEDRAWLLTQRLYLGQLAFVQTVLFGHDDPGDIWVEPGSAADEHEALDIEMIWHTRILPAQGVVHYELDPGHDLQAHADDMRRLLALPGRRLAIARDRDRTALGFTLLVPVCRQTVDTIASNRFIGPMMPAFLARIGPALPSSPQSSRIWYFVAASNSGVQADAVNAALVRDTFNVFAHASLILMTVALEVHKTLFQALGFERLPGELPTLWGMSSPTEAYQLDLDRIGLERWIDAITTGQQLDVRPPGSAAATGVRASSLTARELEVARLMASGLSNRQIADRLVITEKTTKNHVQRVLEKLELHSRAVLVARAAELGLHRSDTGGD